MNDIPLDTVIPRYDRVKSAIAADGFPVYLVGGAVRDFLLGRPSYDLDFIVFGDPENICPKNLYDSRGQVRGSGRARADLPGGLAEDRVRFFGPEGSRSPFRSGQEGFHDQRPGRRFVDLSVARDRASKKPGRSCRRDHPGGLRRFIYRRSTAPAARLPAGGGPWFFHRWTDGTTNLPAARPDRRMRPRADQRRAGPAPLVAPGLRGDRGHGPGRIARDDLPRNGPHEGSRPEPMAQP